MSGNLAESTGTLKPLVDQIMKETDPLRYDELGSEICAFLRTANGLIETVPSANQVSHADQKSVV